MSFYSLLHGISGVRRAVFRDAAGALLEGMGMVTPDTERIATIGKELSDHIAKLSQALELGACKMMVVRTDTMASALVLHDGSLAILDVDPARLSPAVEKTLESRRWSAQPVGQTERPSPHTPRPVTPAPHSIAPMARAVTPGLRPTPTPTPVSVRLRPPTDEVTPPPVIEDRGAVVETEMPHVDTMEMIVNNTQTSEPGPPKPSSSQAPERVLEARATAIMSVRSQKRRLTTTSVLVAAAGDQTMFAGNLRMVSLPDLLEFCRNGRRTGVLFCRHGESVGSVTVQLGRVLRAEAPHVKPLLACLQQRGAVTKDKCEPLGLDSEDEGVDDETVGKLLVEAGLVKQEIIQAAILERIQGAIAEMLEWLDGTFAFHPTDEEELTSEAAGFDPQHILLEIFKLKDEEERDRNME
jgi:hypothetical protein